ncbi:MAG: histidine phosphatase family protein [Candidatus Latescibacterota bacterium]|nr:histidine phosphatase family protein [Candidatus Latescibacterota bacterium]
MTTTIYLLRHGEVHNPEGIIYGRLPGYWLNEVGRGQVRTAGEFLAERGPFDALITSPLERARESAGIIAERLGLTPAVEPRLAETDVSGYQGQPFSALPRPDLTEEGVPGMESAASMRARMLDWVAVARWYERVIAVSHRDPIAMLLLHWLEAPLDRLGELELSTGSVHEACLQDGQNRLRGPAIGD